MAPRRKVVLAVTVFIAAVIAAVHWYYSDRGRFTTEAEFTGLGRSVSSNDLISDYDPALILRFDPNYRHLGGQKFVLYGVADTEQHFFVETTDDDTLKSVYWIQYEAYLPGKSYTYDYDDSPLRVTLGDYEFLPIRPRSISTRTASDGEAPTARWLVRSSRTTATPSRATLPMHGSCT